MEILVMDRFTVAVYLVNRPTSWLVGWLVGV